MREVVLFYQISKILLATQVIKVFKVARREAPNNQINMELA